MPLIPIHAAAQFLGQPGIKIIGNKVLVPRAGVMDKARNVTLAAVRLAGAIVRGRQIFVSEADELSRRATCWACDFWQPTGFLGGQCTHRKCGCSPFKLKLATEKCPLGRWQSVVANRIS